jgi:hypothetical protein
VVQRQGGDVGWDVRPCGGTFEVVGACRRMVDRDGGQSGGRRDGHDDQAACQFDERRAGAVARCDDHGPSRILDGFDRASTCVYCEHARLGSRGVCSHRPRRQLWLIRNSIFQSWISSRALFTRLGSGLISLSCTPAEAGPPRAAPYSAAYSAFHSLVSHTFNIACGARCVKVWYVPGCRGPGARRCGSRTGSRTGPPRRDSGRGG